jgi:hypothetical protein
LDTLIRPSPQYRYPLGDLIINIVAVWEEERQSIPQLMRIKRSRPPRRALEVSRNINDA